MTEMSSTPFCTPSTKVPASRISISMLTSGWLARNAARLRTKGCSANALLT